MQSNIEMIKNQILQAVKPEHQIKIVYKIFKIFEFQEEELINILFNNIENLLVLQETIRNVNILIKKQRITSLMPFL